MSRWTNKYVIGLTGNIAVGKSVVRQMGQHLGAYTIDADGLTHQAMQPGAPAFAPIVEMFGKFILDEDGRINRALLSSLAFTFPDALKRLEAILHPIVIQAISTLISRAPQPIIIVEAIKLLESDLADMVDAVWVVDASSETQVQRLVEKRHLSVEDAQRRLAAQPPQAEKLKRADVVINNGGSVDETWKQVQTAWNALNNKQEAAPETPVVATPAATSQPSTPSASASAGVGTLDIVIRRGMPGNADLIAKFITQTTSKPVDRMDIMLAFGQKSYLLAYDNAQDKVIAVMGWQVENLITRADEFYIDPAVPQAAVIEALVRAIEDASKELQSEVGFILLSPTTRPEIVQSFIQSDYELTSLTNIRVPAWRESVREIAKDNHQILTKKLRTDRVMKPI